MISQPDQSKTFMPVKNLSTPKNPHPGDQILRLCHKTASKGQEKEIPISQFQSHISNHENDCYHLLKGEDECNLFFDLDKKFGAKISDAAQFELLDKYIQSVTKIIIQDHNQPTSPEFAISHGSRMVGNEFKVSFHVVVTNFYCKVTNMKVIAKAANDECKNDCFDLCVYRSWGKMRCVHTYKDKDMGSYLKIIRFNNSSLCINNHILGVVQESSVLLQPLDPMNVVLTQTRDEAIVFDDLVPINESKRYEMMDLIDVQYWTSRGSWIKLGYAMKSSGFSFDDFDRYSKKSANYGNCLPTWQSLKPSACQFGTICYYAQLSDPVKYRLVQDKYVNRKQKDCLNMFFKFKCITNNKMATIFHAEFPSKYVYSRSRWFIRHESGIFRAFNDQNEQVLLDLSFFISAFCMKVFASLPSDDEDKRKAWGAFISRVEDHRFKVNCCNELKSMYLNHDFYSQIDTNLDLVGFLNGVYDLRTGVFRDAKEDEYVTITTGYKYNSVRNEDQITLLKDTIGSSWDLAEERNYFFKHLASTLNGKKEETAHFWIGTGARNGKGTCAGLLMKALGARSQNFQWADWCAGIKGGSQAQPTLLNLKNKTCIITSEPEDESGSDKINSSLFKQFTGRDVFSARDLYAAKDEIETFVPCGVPIFQANCFPKFTSVDQAINNRIKTIQFKYSYVENPDPRDTFKRPVNKNLKEHLAVKGIEMSMMHILLDNYKIYQAEGLTSVPKSFCEMADEYKSDLNSTVGFVNEVTEISPHPGPFVTTKELYDIYLKQPHGEAVLSIIQFSSVLKKNGFDIKQSKANSTKQNMKCIINRRLKPVVEEQCRGAAAAQP